MKSLCAATSAHFDWAVRASVIAHVRKAARPLQGKALATLDRWRVNGERKVDAAILTHITPTRFDHVNLDGVLAFSLGQHRARILPSTPPPEAPDRAVE
jgi:hypothetical protein